MSYRIANINKLYRFMAQYKVYWLYWGVIIALMMSNLSVLYYGLFGNGVMSVVSITISAVADSLLIFVPVCLVSRRYLYLVAVWFTIVTAVIYANVLYMRNFNDCITGVAYLTGGSFNRFVIDGALASLRGIDMVFVLTVLGAFAITRRLRLKYPGKQWRGAMVYIVAACLLTAGQAALSIRRICVYNKVSIADATREYRSGIAQQVAWKDYVLYYGFPTYMLRAVGDNIGAHYELTDDEKHQIHTLIADLARERQIPVALDSAFAANRSKNLILIIVESLNSKVLELPERATIAPELCRMTADSTVIYIPAIEAQTGPGRSSDAQLMYNTGLMALRSEAFVNRYADADYPSLAKSLGRPSAEVIGEDKSLWNHYTTTKSYGYDRLVDNAVPAGTPISDRDSLIFAAALETMKGAEQPFFIEITTIGMHSPYSSDGSVDLKIGGEYDARDRAYLEAVNAFDRSLGQFLYALRAMSVYDNSVIVVVSDHEERQPHLSPIFTDNKIPLFILNSGADPIAVNDRRRMYQIDVFPTIIDVTGYGNVTQYRGLGRSLFDINNDRRLPVDSLQQISEKVIRSGRWP